MGGKPLTFVQGLPHLLTVWLGESRFRRWVWRCRCESGPCAEVPAGADLPAGEWSVCPYGVLRGPHFSALLALWRQAEVSSVSHWPDGWPAWLGWGIVQLRQRVAVEQAVKR